MKTFKPVPTEIVSEITCDCCQTCFTVNDAGWSEIQSIEFVAGYSSIFGDGNSVSIDLCQDCLKQHLGPWLCVETEQRRGIGDEALSKSLIKALHQSVERAHASIDDAVRFVEESNLRIEGMEKSGRRLGALKDKIEIADDFDALPPDESVQRELDGAENLPPPRGYQSWLQYAIETMETRSLEIEGIFDEWADHAGKAVSREEMRAAAQRELLQVLKGSVLKYEDPTELVNLGSTTEPIENLKGMLHKPEAPVSIDDMHAVCSTKNQGWDQEWNTGPPVGCEFSADSARFTRVLQRAISVFGNPLEAVQWLTSFNALVDGEPMKRVIGSEEGCTHVMAILSEIETGGVA